jgi:hypothetical protein
MYRTWPAEDGIHKLTRHEIVFYYEGGLLYSKLGRSALDDGEVLDRGLLVKVPKV